MGITYIALRGWALISYIYYSKNSLIRIPKTEQLLYFTSVGRKWCHSIVTLGKKLGIISQLWKDKLDQFCKRPLYPEEMLIPSRLALVGCINSHVNME